MCRAFCRAGSRHPLSIFGHELRADWLPVCLIAPVVCGRADALGRLLRVQRPIRHGGVCSVRAAEPLRHKEVYANRTGERPARGREKCRGHAEQRFQDTL